MENNQQENNQQQSTNELVVRREKLANLVRDGKNPFELTKYDVTHSAPDAIAEFAARESELGEGETITVRVAGRMVSRRIMGKASFAHLQDGDGKIQLYIARDGIGEEEYAGFFCPLSSTDEFLPALQGWSSLQTDCRESLILFKGSRSNRLERYVNLFLEEKGHAV